MKAKILVVLCLTALLFPVAATAQQQTVDCGGGCPEGKVLVSFTDGNNVTCVCQDQAAMDDTVADPNLPEGEVDQPS